MLSSLTLQTPRKVARSATVIATRAPRLLCRSSVADSCAASAADSIGSMSKGLDRSLAKGYQERRNARFPYSCINANVHADPPAGTLAAAKRLASAPPRPERTVTNWRPLEV